MKAPNIYLKTEFKTELVGETCSFHGLKQQQNLVSTSTHQEHKNHDLKIRFTEVAQTPPPTVILAEVKAIRLELQQLKEQNGRLETFLKLLVDQIPTSNVQSFENNNSSSSFHSPTQSAEITADMML